MIPGRRVLVGIVVAAAAAAVADHSDVFLLCEHSKCLPLLQSFHSLPYNTVGRVFNFNKWHMVVNNSREYIID